MLSYDEKITLLIVLVNGIHELNEFRVFLNKRVEEKSGYNKEKMEIYTQIKNLEQEWSKLAKK